MCKGRKGALIPRITNVLEVVETIIILHTKNDILSQKVIFCDSQFVLCY